MTLFDRRPSLWFALGALLISAAHMRWGFGILAFFAPIPMLRGLRVGGSPLWFFVATMAGWTLAVLKITTDPIPPTFAILFSVPIAVFLGLRYFDVVDPRIALTWTERRLVMKIPQLPGPVSRPPSEYTLTAIWRLTRLASGLDWAPDSVEFPFPKPSDAAEHRRVFEAPIRYDCPHPALTVPAHWWSRKPQKANQALGQLLDAHAEQLAWDAPRDTSLEASVRQAIAAVMAGQEPTAARVAKDLGMSARTLHRRLKAENLLFGAVADGLRLHQSRAHLAVPGVGIAEVSWLLGFSDPSAFSRAFKRWTGQTPGEYRTGI